MGEAADRDRLRDLADGVHRVRPRARQGPASERRARRRIPDGPRVHGHLGHRRAFVDPAQPARGRRARHRDRHRPVPAADRVERRRPRDQESGRRPAGLARPDHRVPGHHVGRRPGRDLRAREASRARRHPARRGRDLADRPRVRSGREVSRHLRAAVAERTGPRIADRRDGHQGRAVDGRAAERARARDDRRVRRDRHDPRGRGPGGPARRERPHHQRRPRADRRFDQLDLLRLPRRCTGRGLHRVQRRRGRRCEDGPRGRGGRRAVPGRDVLLAARGPRAVVRDGPGADVRRPADARQREQAAHGRHGRCDVGPRVRGVHRADREHRDRHHARLLDARDRPHRERRIPQAQRRHRAHRGRARHVLSRRLGDLTAHRARRRRQKDGAHRDDTVSSTIVVDGLPAWKRMFPGLFCRYGRRGGAAHRESERGATITFCPPERP
ncbi:Putative Uncharacterized 50.6 kDa protein in the 5'region of gyrA and gyrB [Burkholderia diffusa]|nr:Putative Uncharacterized 50.6 kDa protein in the 5'region of gyrA and gyrB [Burkholderia diffusa]